MAKRFTDTNKWEKAWFRKLSPKYKCFWDFILSKCDLAGFWDIDFESAEHFIGEKIEEKKIREYFFEQIIFLNNKKWVVKDFIKFQNGIKPLTEKSPIHAKILEILNKNSLTPSLLDTLCNRVIVVVEVEEEVEGEEKERVESEKKTEKTKLEKSFDDFLAMRVKIKRPATERAIILLKNKIWKIANGDENIAIEVINQSIVNSWQDVFPLRTENNFKNGTKTEPERRGGIRVDSVRAYEQEIRKAQQMADKPKQAGD